MTSSKKQSAPKVSSAPLLSDVMSKAQNSRPGTVPWYVKLPPEVMRELEAVRAAYDPSTVQKRAFALALIEAARERGWQIAGYQQVIRWLDTGR